MHNLFKFLFLTFLIILSGCSSSNLNMSCRTDYDCGYGNSCRSKVDGETECRVKTAVNEIADTSYKSTFIPKPTPPVSSGTIRLPSNQADEQIAKNTDQKEITTNVIREKDGVAYLPNETKPFTGKYIENHPNGKKQLETNYKNGKENGIETFWDENGHKESESNYKNGTKDGVETWWYENGQKKTEYYYKNGTRVDGVETFWDENGHKGTETRYKNGKKNGVETFWDEGGRKIKELVWKNDALMENSTDTSTSRNKNKLCEIDSNFAESIMKFRQNGESMSKIMNINQDVTQSKANRERADQLIIAAYEKPRFSSGEYQKKSIEDFRDKAYLDCVKAAR